MAIYEVPLSPNPQTLSIAFPNGVKYQLTLTYLFKPNDCWNLDIADDQGNQILCGVPLVSGVDLFSQYDYLNFDCSMYCTVDGDASADPKFYNLGITAHLWIEG